nr:unnamed protein product [Digitaria exilis]
MLADKVNIPCRVVKGCKYCKSDDASSCLVRFGLERSLEITSNFSSVAKQYFSDCHSLNLLFSDSSTGQASMKPDIIVPEAPREVLPLITSSNMKLDKKKELKLIETQHLRHTVLLEQFIVLIGMDR